MPRLPPMGLILPEGPVLRFCRSCTKEGTTGFHKNFLGQGEWLCGDCWSDRADEWLDQKRQEALEEEQHEQAQAP